MSSKVNILFSLKWIYPSLAVSNAKKRLKRSYSNGISRNLSCHWYLKKKWKNMIKKSFLSQKEGDFWNLLEKEMRIYVLYLIWIYSTLTSLTLLLMTKSAWSKVGASKNLSVLSRNAKFTCWPCFVSWRHIKFSKICLLFWSEFMSEYFPKWVTQLFRLSNTDSANRFSFLKNF